MVKAFGALTSPPVPSSRTADAERTDPAAEKRKARDDSGVFGKASEASRRADADANPGGNELGRRVRRSIRHKPRRGRSRVAKARRRRLRSRVKPGNSLVGSGAGRALTRRQDAAKEDPFPPAALRAPPRVRVRAERSGGKDFAASDREAAAIRGFGNRLGISPATRPASFTALL